MIVFLRVINGKVHIYSGDRNAILAMVNDEVNSMSAGDIKYALEHDTLGQFIEVERIKPSEAKK
jgi:hypothetical protein